MKPKKKKEHFLSMLLGTLGVILSGGEAAIRASQDF